MSKKIEISPLPWNCVWHTARNAEEAVCHDDFTICDANGNAILYEGNGCSPLDPEFICEAVNYYAWAKGQLEMLGIRPPPEAEPKL